MALELGRINPSALLKPVEGYGFAAVPGDATAQIRAEMNAVDPSLGNAVTGVALRSITKGGKGIGVRRSSSPSTRGSPCSPALQDAYLDGFSSGATKARDITIGKTRTRFAQMDGAITGYAWQRFAGFVQVVTEKSADAKLISRGR